MTSTNEIKQFRKLASAVILNAINDFLSRKPKNIKKQTQWKIKIDMAYDFLTGKTEIGLFWFMVAGVEPLSSGKEELRERLTKNRELLK